jgi:tight adherence protein B
MTAILLGVLVLGAWLALSPPGSPARRARTALPPDPDPELRAPAPADRFPGARRLLGRVLPVRARGDLAYVPMTVVVQQLAALLTGGRAAARLWDELWLLYAGDPAPGGRLDHRPGPALAPASVAMLAATRAAALRGSPVAEAIRSTAAGTPPGGSGPGITGLERRVWGELAACFDIAEASGCPLADVLTRFAAQLEAEDDAEAARQTALAGPRATVRLLSWLPLLGLGLGMLLGVDPVRILLGTPYGIAALATGVSLTAAGRIWSARLVRAAAGPQ